MTGCQIGDGEVDAVAEGVEPFSLRKRDIDRRLHPATPYARVPVRHLVVTIGSVSEVGGNGRPVLRPLARHPPQRVAP